MRAAGSAEAVLEAAGGATDTGGTGSAVPALPRTAYRESLLGAVRAFGERGLSALERVSRNHDKHANRIARDELEQLRGSNRAVEELCARAEELMAALGREITGTSRGRRHQLARALAECARGVHDQAAALERYGLEIPNTDGWQAAVDAAAAADATDDDAASAGDTAPGNGGIADAHAPGFDVLAAELQTLDERMAAGESLATLKPTHDQLAGNWLAQADRAQPDKDQKARFETVSHRYRELVEADRRLNDMEFRSVDMPSEAGRQARRTGSPAGAVEAAARSGTGPQPPATPVALGTLAILGPPAPGACVRGRHDSRSRTLP